MSIVSSTYVEDHAQADGRHYVTETHTDHLGNKYVVEYLAAVGTNYATVMTARAAQIEADLAEQEAAALLAG